MGFFHPFAGLSNSGSGVGVSRVRLDAVQGESHLRVHLALVSLVVLAAAACSEDDTPSDTSDTDTGTPLPDDSDLDTDLADTDPPDTDLPEPDPLDIDDDGDGYSENDGDCDDDDPLLSPGLPEICENGLDDDCDTVVDDMEPGTIEGPFAYLQASDSPWDTLGLSVFVLEDFEDQTFPAGVSASTFSWSSTFAGVEDSVDGDDGDPTDGGCDGCEAVWAGSAITFTFDPVVLGGLPTHAGLVLTDAGTADVTANLSATTTCVTLGAVTAAVTFGDGSISGDTAEDRFVGFVTPAGVTSLTVNLGTPLEVDHLQFGW